MKNIRRITAALALLTVLLTVSVAAPLTPVNSPQYLSVSSVIEDWTHPAGWKFWLPDTWKTHEEDGCLVAQDAAKEVYVEFLVPKNTRQLDRALDDLEEDLHDRLKSIKYDQPTSSSEDGISELFITGHALDRKDGDEVEFDLGIYEKKGKLLIVFGVTSADNFSRYDKQFRKILDSIR